jgi:hypothetical protein
MVVLKITAKTETGRSILEKLGKEGRSVQEIALGVQREIVSEKPLVLQYTYQKKLDSIIARDASLKKFTIDRGLQMAEELVAQHGGSKKDISAEVFI